MLPHRVDCGFVAVYDADFERLTFHIVHARDFQDTFDNLVTQFEVVSHKGNCETLSEVMKVILLLLGSTKLAKNTEVQILISGHSLWKLDNTNESLDI